MLFTCHTNQGRAMSTDAASAIRSVCVFCGSSTGSRPEYADAARRLGSALAGRGLELVYGAGNVGLMGVLADAALAAGGRVVGVIPRSLMLRELAHQGLSELHVVETMHQRKSLMADLSDAFVALSGGFGTADELFEILTWAQLGIHTKPIGLLNVGGFFDPLLGWVRHAAAEGFVREQHVALLNVSTDAEELLDALLRRGPPSSLPKWADRDDR
jgi:uncharacterized protein (TIGR00730 family)